MQIGKVDSIKKMADDFLLDETETVDDRRLINNSGSVTKNNNSPFIATSNNNSLRIRILTEVIIPAVGQCSTQNASAQELLVTLTDAMELQSKLDF